MLKPMNVTIAGFDEGPFFYGYTTGRKFHGHECPLFEKPDMIRVLDFMQRTGQILRYRFNEGGQRPNGWHHQPTFRVWELDGFDSIIGSTVYTREDVATVLFNPLDGWAFKDTGNTTRTMLPGVEELHTIPAMVFVPPQHDEAIKARELHGVTVTIPRRPKLQLQLNACWFCAGTWGNCTCGWPDADNHPNDVPETCNGFAYEDMWITSPNVSPCERFYVHPILAYGLPFLVWVMKQAPLLHELSNARLLEIQEAINRAPAREVAAIMRAAVKGIATHLEPVISAEPNLMQSWREVSPEEKAARERGYVGHTMMGQVKQWPDSNIATAGESPSSGNVRSLTITIDLSHTDDGGARLIRNRIERALNHDALRYTITEVKP